MYPAELVKPMSQDLTEFGFTGLETSEAVVTALDQPEGTTLLVVNSVCGCAAANAGQQQKCLSKEKINQQTATQYLLA